MITRLFEKMPNSLDSKPEALVVVLFRCKRTVG